MIATHYLAKPARDAYLFQAWGSKGTPYLSVITLVTGIALARGENIVFKRFGPRFMLPLVVVATAVCYSSLPALVSWMPRLSTAILSVVVATMNGFSVAYVWAAANSQFEGAEARAWYSVIGLGGQIGAVVGSYAAEWLSAHYPPSVLLLVDLALLVVLLPILFRVQRGGEGPRRDANGFLTKERAERESLDTTGLKIVLGYRYTRLLLLLVLASTCMTSVVKWGLFRIADTASAGLSDSAHFFAASYRRITIVSLVCQVFVTPLALRLLGPSPTLFILPLFALTAGTVAALAPTPVGLAWLTVIYLGLDYTVNQCSRELMYLPTPIEICFKAKGLIDATGRGGVLLGSGVAIAISQLFGASLLSVAVTIVMISAVVLYTTWQVQADFRRLNSSVARTESVPASLQP